VDYIFFWFVYLIFSFFLAFFASKFFHPKKRNYALILTFIFLITPWFVEADKNNLSPAILIFLFDILLENSFSYRSLRPLLVSMTSVSLILYCFYRIKLKLEKKI
tara:strand:+ start:902 stop:1216 length:315 start_codon:yes stop_codon:yes gene_type:complete